MPTVATDAEAYQDLARIRERIDYDGDSLFADNEALRFDELLVELERESRGIFETLWGDETPLEENDRVDTFASVPYDAALTLVYPIQEVSTVEVKRTKNSEWDELESHQYDATDHNLILAERPTTNQLRYENRRGNALTRHATRPTWGDVAATLRVTYDRGFEGGAPADVKSIQIQLINRMCRNLKREQTVAAASPEEFAGQTEMASVVTDEIRARIGDVTSPGGATQVM